METSLNGPVNENYLISHSTVKAFILAGKSIFTVKNSETGRHLTFKVVKKDEQEGSRDKWLVLSSYEYQQFVYVGILTKMGNSYKFVATNRSKPSSVTFKTFDFINNNYLNADKPDSRVSFYHEGKCAFCGRPMNDPESIERGMGPTCFKRATQASWLDFSK